MKANVGDTILFQRNNLKITGSVLNLYTESVLVEITDVSGGTFEFDRTIVNHKNYKILHTNTQSETLISGGFVHPPLIIS
ncbi:YkvS family protein [Bacillus anthracis]|nr:YkvS family protein [Bacillus anthracis]